MGWGDQVGAGRGIWMVRFLHTKKKRTIASRDSLGLARAEEARATAAGGDDGEDGVCGGVSGEETDEGAGGGGEGGGAGGKAR